MYGKYFNFKCEPFAIEADAQIFYKGGQYAQVLRELIQAGEEKHGIFKLTGPKGIGKSLMVAQLRNHLATRCKVIIASEPVMSPNRLVNYILSELKISNQKLHKQKGIALLHQWLAQEEKHWSRILVVIDNAQTMPIISINELNSAANTEMPEGHFFNVLLVGEPELDDLLALGQDRQLVANIEKNLKLAPLERQEVINYLNSRAEQAGYQGQLFNVVLANKIARLSNGIPHNIQLLADEALKTAYNTGATELDAKHLKVSDEAPIYRHTQASRSLRKNGRLYAFLGAMLCAGIAIIAYYSLNQNQVNSSPATPQKTLQEQAKLIGIDVFDENREKNKATSVNASMELTTTVEKTDATANALSLFPEQSQPLEQSVSKSDPGEDNDHAIAADEPSIKEQVTLAPEEEIADEEAYLFTDIEDDAEPLLIVDEEDSLYGDIPDTIETASFDKEPAILAENGEHNTRSLETQTVLPALTQAKENLQAWLAKAPPEAGSIQLLLLKDRPDNLAHLENILNRLAKHLDSTQMMLYSSEMETGLFHGVLYRQFANRSQAKHAIASLPPEIVRLGPFITRSAGRVKKTALKFKQSPSALTKADGALEQAYLNLQRWLATAEPTASTIQLLLAKAGPDSKIEAYLKQLHKVLDPSHFMVYFTYINDQPFYGVLYQRYADHESAKRAIADLPQAVSYLKPFMIRNADRILQTSKQPSFSKDIAETDVFDAQKPTRKDTKPQPSVGTQQKVTSTQDDGGNADLFSALDRAYLNFASWVITAASTEATIQLSLVDGRKQSLVETHLQSLEAQLNPKSIMAYFTYAQGQPVYCILYQQFPDKDAAENAIAGLPEEISELGPFSVRNAGEIQTGAFLPPPIPTSSTQAD